MASFLIDALVLLDEQGRIDSVSAAAEALFGHTTAELAGKRLGVLLEPEGAQLCEAELAGDRSRLGERRELQGRCKDGSVFPLELTLGALEMAGRKLVACIVRSLAENRRLETVLREREARMKAVVDTAVDAIITIDEESIIDSFNLAAERMFGYKAEEVIGQNVKILMPAPYREEHDEYVSNYLETGRKRIIGIGREVTGRRKDGSLFPMELAVSEVRLGERRLFTGMLRDISERRRVEEALASERELMAVTLRSVGDGVITTDIQGKILLLSRVAEALTGWTQAEAQGRSVEQVFVLMDETTRRPRTNLLKPILEANSVSTLAEHSILISRNGAERRIDDICAPLHDRNSRCIGAVIAFRDVTEKRRMEQERLSSQKLEFIGVLAGGIAHDFNNFLGEIVVNLNLAKMSLEPQNEAFDILTDAEKATVRARDLTRQLLTFSKGGAPIKKLVAIGPRLRDTARFALSGSNVRCDFKIAEDLWALEVDEGQISQVLNNLIINAVQAMPMGGTILLRAENVIAGFENHHALPPGRYVELSLKDHGIGIPREHLPRIFDPYFTTKSKGNGLGLATSHSIIRRHEGLLRVESELGVGTTFYVLLPAASSGAASTQDPAGLAQGGKGRILIMDDSDGLRIATGKILTRLGYEVETARDGGAAIELYQRGLAEGKAFDAVLMDLTISGGMGGKEAIQRLLALDPKVRAVAASGYSTDPIMANFRDYGFRGMIAKPFDKSELAKVLRDVLAEPA